MGACTHEVSVLSARAGCPPEGDAVQQLARNLNVLKNRHSAPQAADLDNRVSLKALLEPGDDLQRWDHDRGAEIKGYVVNVKVGGIETANCHAKDPLDRDTHIELALASAASETERVIVEVTPWWRKRGEDDEGQEVDWRTSSLRDALIGRKVSVRGWLLEDLEHKGQAKNTNPGGDHDWRATIWEIHPITRIEVLGE